eukprot:SAG31_NODE_13737_length_850_cov_1.234354_1_plen_114_part_00
MLLLLTACLCLGAASQPGQTSPPPPVIPPPAGGTAWYDCLASCNDPRLCSPLNPQPGKRWEVVAPQSGGWPNSFGGGENGSEWNLWLAERISRGKVRAVTFSFLCNYSRNTGL